LIVYTFVILVLKNVNLSVENDRTPHVKHSLIEKAFYDHIRVVETQINTEKY